MRPRRRWRAWRVRPSDVERRAWRDEQSIAEVLGEAKENDLVVCLISRGGSALAKEVIRSSLRSM